MVVAKVPTLLTVLAGHFESQPLAFACLLDEAERRSMSIDLADADVIQSAANVRLAHYFRPQIVARIQEAQGEDNTVVVLRPTELATLPDFPAVAGPLRLLGRYAGEVVEIPGQHGWA